MNSLLSEMVPLLRDKLQTEKLRSNLAQKGICLVITSLLLFPPFFFFFFFFW